MGREYGPARQCAQTFGRGAYRRHGSGIEQGWRIFFQASQQIENQCGGLGTLCHRRPDDERPAALETGPENLRGGTGQFAFLIRRQGYDGSLGKKHPERKRSLLDGRDLQLARADTEDRLAGQAQRAGDARRAAYQHRATALLLVEALANLRQGMRVEPRLVYRGHGGHPRRPTGGSFAWVTGTRSSSAVTSL